MTKTGGAVVIGASGGIGALVATSLCSRGLHVLGVDPQDPADSMRTELYSHLCLDAAEPEAVETIIAKLRGQRAGTIINVAGGATSREVEQASALDFVRDVEQQTMSGNFSTSLVAIDLARSLRVSMSQDEDVSVTLCSSINAVGSFGYPIYSGSKGAVESLVSSLSVPLGRIGVRLNCVRLGTVVTPASLSLHGGVESPHYKPLLDLAPLGRFVSGDEAAAALIATAVDLTGMTGVVIPVDAGQSLPGPR